MLDRHIFNIRPDWIDCHRQDAGNRNKDGFIGIFFYEESQENQNRQDQRIDDDVKKSIEAQIHVIGKWTNDIIDSQTGKNRKN